MKTIIGLINVIDSNGTELSHIYQYEIDCLYTAFYITLYNIIVIKNWHIKICGNCGKYFLIQKNFSYCERIVAGDNTCKDVEKKNIKKENKEVMKPIVNIEQLELERKLVLLEIQK